MRDGGLPTGLGCVQWPSALVVSHQKKKKKKKMCDLCILVELLLYFILNLILLEYSSLTVLSVSGVQPGQSVMHINIFILFSHIGYYKLLSRFSCALQ